MRGLFGSNVWGRGDVGYGGTKKRRHCTMYKKVLYNIKKNKKCGGGRGAIIEPKTLSMYF